MNPHSPWSMKSTTSKASTKATAWPTRDSGPIGRGDSRTWAQIDAWLRARGISLDERVEKMRRGDGSQPRGD